MLNVLEDVVIIFCRSGYPLIFITLPQCPII